MSHHLLTLSGQLPQACRIAAVAQETPTVRSFVLAAQMEAQPGQFVMAWLPGLDEKPFSLADADPVTLAVAGVGPFSHALHTLRVGDRVWLRGPFGRGFALGGELSTAAGPLLLVGGGYGAAPLLFLARRARGNGREVWVALGAKVASELLFASRFEALGCRVEAATEDGSRGHRGLVSELAARLLGEGGVAGLAACGPEGLLRAAAELGRAAGVPTEVSREAYMRCGIGVCGSCACGGQLVCRDGPVFRV